jgi:ribosomal protein S18 acetylase RimI-like enzyme
MSDGLTFRPLTPTDAPALHRALWFDVSLAEAEDRVQTIVYAQERMRAWGLVVESGGELVGFGQLTRWGLRGEICNLIVREGWRGQGIGTRLIGRLVEIVREQRLHDVEIGVAESNTRALALYRRLGFHDQRRVMFDLDAGIEPVTYLVMDLDGTRPR